jgi:DNA-binding NtrC family response regulator
MISCSVSSEPKSILVIDHNSDCGVLLVRTLMRKFPATVIQICGDAITAVKAIESSRHDAIVLHRTEELSCVELLHVFRKLDPVVPIIAVSGVDRTAETMAAGATAFLSYEEWLRVGMFLQEILQRRKDERREAYKAVLSAPPGESTPPIPLAQRLNSETATLPVLNPT